jgi:hypothetical protein
MKRGAGALPDFSVELVYALVGFVLLLSVGGIVYVQLSSSSDSDICALSVLARGTAPASAQALLPLKCQTQKTCFTCATCDTKRPCQESFAGEQGVRVITLPLDSVEGQRIIAQETAEAYYRCWKRMGQGKISLFGGYLQSRGLAVGDSVCVVCDRLALDGNLDPSYLEGLDIQSYLRDTRVPEHKETYLALFTNGQVQSYPSVSASTYSVAPPRVSQETSGLTYGSSTIGRDRQGSIVFMQVEAPSITDTLTQLGTDGLIVAGGAFFTPPGRAGTKLIGMLPAKVARAGGIATAVGTIGIAGLAASNTYASHIVANGYCGNFQSGTAGSKGCSVFELLPYRVSWLNGLCSEIEGVP